MKPCEVCPVRVQAFASFHDDMNLQPFLTFARQLAYRAGQITLHHYNNEISHEFKPDETPVTAADRQTEEFIRGEIEKEYPSHAIFGEEFGEKTGEENPFRWIVDPIDGTKSFMKGVPLYSVLIALEIEGVSRVGVVCFPALDDILSAADGLGCWWNDRRTRVSEVSDLKQAVFLFTSWSGFRTVKKLGLFERLHKECFFGRAWGDAYGNHMVATGRSEVMLEPAVDIWDAAPFAPIFREAGGFFGSWGGREGHTHGEALACNNALKPKILELIQSV